MLFEGGTDWNPLSLYIVVHMSLRGIFLKFIPASKNSCPTCESGHLWINTVITLNGDRPIAMKLFLKHAQQCYSFGITVLTVLGQLWHQLILRATAKIHA